MVFGLTKTEVTALRDEIAHCKRPLIFFHDDADGLASFLLLYRKIGAGKGVVIKTHPQITTQFLRQVREYGPDKIFIVDIAMVDQDFIDQAGAPVIWIDHHGPYERDRVKYFNPRVNGENAPAAYLCYQVVSQDAWIAMAGIVADWFLSPLAKEFSKRYPDLLPKGIDTPQKALFTTEIGRLGHILTFALKGDAREAMKYVKVLTRINDPYEILNQTTPKGSFVYKKYLKFHSEYTEILADAETAVTEDRLIIYRYPTRKTSFTGELSNELLFRHPDKVILIGRQNNGMLKCSLRSGESLVINTILERALVSVDGYGGGHEHACGCCINISDVNMFIDNLRREIGNEKETTKKGKRTQKQDHPSTRKKKASSTKRKSTKKRTEQQS